MYNKNNAKTTGKYNYIGGGGYVKDLDAGKIRVTLSLSIEDLQKLPVDAKGRINLVAFDNRGTKKDESHFDLSIVESVPQVKAATQTQGRATGTGTRMPF